MPLTTEEAISWIKTLVAQRQTEKSRLDKIHNYLRGKQPNIVAPPGSVAEVKRLADMARVNFMEIVVSALSQALYVDGFRAARTEEDDPAWKVWQANRMDASQIGIHRSAITYGVGYATIMPGDPQPVIRGYSPRRLTAMYDIDDELWPTFALISEPMGKGMRHKLLDSTHVYIAKEASTGNGTESQFDLDGEPQAHGQAVTPVVRFLNLVDLDEDRVGEVEPLMQLQDQADLTTFSLLVAQHYQAFRQRYIVGWVPKTEEEALKASAARVWLFDDENVKVGDFEETDLDGYLESREATLRHAATLSQTPVHELIGQLVNLSAEALVAADASQRRKVIERQKSFGESWEQLLGQAGVLVGEIPSVDAEVRWADTENRAFAATVDALGKLVTMLHIPPAELLERIPFFTQQDVVRIKEAMEKADVMGQLNAQLERQMGAAA